MDPTLENALLQNRRTFLGRMSTGIGSLALGALLNPALLRAAEAAGQPALPGSLHALHHKPTAKRVIYLFMSGGPSHIDMWDYKPKLKQYHGTELPGSIRMGQRITGMTSGQKEFPCVAPMFEFKQHGESGAWVSELLPHTAKMVDDIAVIKSVHTEAINHDPAITLIQTGFQQPGRPSNGAWFSYGLGSENRDLPGYIVLVSQTKSGRNPQPLFARLWGSGFLPSKHQGVKFRSEGDPVLYLSDPPGFHKDQRRQVLDSVEELNRHAADAVGDPEIHTRIAQYEMAYRMQASVPDLMDISGEPQSVLDLYGPDATKPGTFAANCLLARRLAERDVRFIQLFHRDWDQHSNLPNELRQMCRDTDQPAWGLVQDLKQRGLLDDTLVIWGGEFGRTVYSQGALTKDNYGRDHHGRCFTMWLAGGGTKPGIVYGETDDYCYNITKDPVHVHDLNATLLHTFGVDHTKLLYRYQGRDMRLTDIAGEVVKGVLA